MQIIYTIIFFFTCLCVIRYIAYHSCIDWKNDRSVSCNPKYDKMYEEALKEPKELMADYDKLNIESFRQGYYTCLLRKYPWSNASDFHLELANIQDGQHLLDVGCGTGVHAIHYCKKMPHLTISCIVNSKKCFQQTFENIEKAKLSSRIKVYFMDFDKLEEPILSERFDRILLIQSVGYSVNRKALFNNLRHLLKKEGKLFVSTISVSDNVDDDHVNQVIKTWKYNFSTLGCILSDLKDYQKVNYISLNQNKSTWFFLNPMDLYYTWDFNKLNHINICDLTFYFTKSMNNQFILAS
jgi:ubiquinone/menaquinone biosynthesis C-methylase UbiE